MWTQANDGERDAAASTGGWVPATDAWHTVQTAPQRPIRDLLDLRTAVADAAWRGQLIAVAYDRLGALARAIDDGPALVLDLGPMCRIREVDLERGLAIIEAGVTQTQLDQRLAETGWIANFCSRDTSTSMLEAALADAWGTFRATSRDLIGVECVLANGEAVQVGEGWTIESSPGRGAVRAPLTLPPDAVVVSAGVIELHRRPEAISYVQVEAAANDVALLVGWVWQAFAAGEPLSSVVIRETPGRDRFVASGCIITTFNDEAEAVARLHATVAGQAALQIHTHGVGLASVEIEPLRFRPRAEARLEDPTARTCEVIMAFEPEHVAALRMVLVDLADVFEDRPVVTYRVIEEAWIAAQIQVPSAPAHRARVVAALRRRCAPRGFEVRLDRVDDATASYPFS